MFDPKVGRFLTPDPIVSSPLNGQSWNRYSYVLNNPLAYTDPSGFSESDTAYVVPEGNPPGIYYVEPGGSSGIYTEVIQVNGVLPTGFTKDVIVGASPFEPTAEAVESGGSQAPVDVNTTGNTAGFICAGRDRRSIRMGTWCRGIAKRPTGRPTEVKR